MLNNFGDAIEDPTFLAIKYVRDKRFLDDLSIGLELMFGDRYMQLG
jgi:hypothetical protein